MASFVITVGPTGRDFTTLQAAWASMPSTIDVADDYTITMAAGLYTAGLDVTADPKTLNGTLVIKPEAGAAWYEQAGAPNVPVRYDNTKGVAIEAAPSLKAIFHLRPRTSVEGIQFKGGSTKGAINYSGSVTAETNISRCVFSANATSTFCLNFNVAFVGNVFNNVFITTYTGTPITFNDTPSGGLFFVGNTVIKPEGGGGVWNGGSFGTGLRVIDCAIFGFSGSNTARINTGASTNNATDLATLFGSSVVANLVAADQFTDATAASLDLRPKAGNSLVAGVTNALISADAFGVTRAATPTIGALEYVVVGSASVTVNYTEASDTIAVSVDIASGSTTATVAYTEASDTVAAQVQVGATLTTRQFRNNTGPTGLRANVANVALNIYNATTGALVLRLTGLTTTAQGRLVVTNAALAAGTTYAYEADFSAAGLGRRLPTVAAA